MDLMPVSITTIFHANQPSVYSILFNQKTNQFKFNSHKEKNDQAFSISI